MKTASVFLCGVILLMLFPFNVGATTFNYNSSVVPIDKNLTWDNPNTDKFEQVMSTLFPGDTLTQVNGIFGETETWYGDGAYTVILEEIAGYRNKTTFGWYDRSDPFTDYHQMFAGSDAKGDSKDTFFGDRHFGFYIDPNGKSRNRMYTEHDLNNGDQYQVAIFQLNNNIYDYVLAWEDFALTGKTDKDYQDMIVRMRVNSAETPEPASMLLLGSGLVAIAGFGRKKFINKRKK